MVRARGLVVLAVATLVAVACGGSSGGGTNKGTIKIGSDFPVCTVGGQSTANGVKFAVDTKNSAGGVEGFTIAYTSFDDCRQGSYKPDARGADGRSMLARNAAMGMSRTLD